MWIRTWIGCVRWRVVRRLIRGLRSVVRRASHGEVTAAGDDDGIGVGAEIMKQENDTGNTPPAMSVGSVGCVDDA